MPVRPRWLPGRWSTGPTGWAASRRRASRNVELTGPYFHNGGNLTLRQQLDFYLRGGNFPLSNSSHRDFLIANLNIEDEALGGVDPITRQPAFTEEQKEHAKNSLIDFLLELTDERVRLRAGAV